MHLRFAGWCCVFLSAVLMGVMLGCGSKQEKIEKAEAVQEEFHRVMDDTQFLLHPPPKFETAEEAWVWPDVRFLTKRHEVAYRQAPVLDELAKYLRGNPSIVLEVTGHADHRGPESYNLDLSLKRAWAVRDYLVREGVEEYQLLISADGETRLRTTDQSKEGLAMNRRVEISAGPQ